MSDSPRKRIVKILMNIDKNDAYINIEMNKLRGENTYSDIDLRFIGQIVNGVIKHRITIDYLISKFSKVPVKKIAPFVLATLRSGIYQIIYMDKVPDSAAVNESVKIIKKSSVSRLSGYVNAVLRAVDKSIIDNIDISSVEGISIYYSYPEWLVTRWVNLFGFDFTVELMKAFNSNPSMHIRRSVKISSAALLDSLKSDNIITKKINFSFAREFDYCYNIGNVGDLGTIRAYKDSMFYIQDSAAAFASYLLCPKKGQTVIDMCAAPGGKSLFIAELMENTGRVISCDIYEHKINLIKENCDKYAITAVEPVICDATVNNEVYNEIADRVLCDVPCSGLGIIQKKPDIKYARCEEDILELSKLGYEIISNGAKYLKKGGILVYSTCTIDPEENEEVINKFLCDHPGFSPYPFDGENYYKTFYPHIHETDGFFVCRLKKEC